EHSHDGVAGAELFRQPNGARHIDAGRTAEAETFVQKKIEDQRDRLFVWHEIGLVYLHVCDDRRDAAKPDALGDRAALARFRLAMREKIIHRGAARIGDADDDFLFHFTQIAGNPGDGAAGADGANKAIDSAVGLLPDLGAGGD